MNATAFSRIAESLRQYRRAELKDFAADVGGNPIDDLYVDPLPGNAVLSTVLAGNTTFLTGRKGTGKSTVFAKAQSEIRKRSDLISIYIDVKSLHELAVGNQPVVFDQKMQDVDPAILRAHQLKKHFLGEVIRQLISELEKASESMTLIDRWIGRKRGYKDLIKELMDIAERVSKCEMHAEELPVLREISAKAKRRSETEKQKEKSTRVSASASVNPFGIGGEVNGELGSSDFAKTLDDKELYHEYSDVVLKTFPFTKLIGEIIDLLDEAKLLRLVVFFDDFSELEWVSQRLFVDVILSPLNNATNERIKLKIAGYPGRVYYGRIDPGKVDTMCLDFSQLYKSNELQTAEANAIDYTRRLLEKRFAAFGQDVTHYFDPSADATELFKLLFHASTNAPRLLGYVLYYCYLDRVSRGLGITAASIRLASNKYYSSIVAQYFDRAGRFALEPFERKLDRHNQQRLLKTLLTESTDLKKRIYRGEVGGSYFSKLGGNPPVSHFYIDPKLESVLSSLEFNFLVTKYSDTRDKNGRDVSVFAFFYGLAEAEKFAWGYPPGRDYRNYFVQRCFDYNRVIHQFLSKTTTIRCDECGACFSMDDEEKIAFYRWKCPECQSGICSVVQLSDDFESEVAKLDEALMLEEVELEILNVLEEADDWMRAGEISLLIDGTYQLVGHRTSKLQDQDLVHKEMIDGHRRSQISQKAKDIYFA
ncbi:PHD finger domain-containing protein [Thalassoglobus sp. JC818]|uniref:PHD finger domain-containing protein n=1 Tax=Thalassoglobus sp. JC818 TaxID=3232136 RepID=UPI003457F28A